MSQKSSVQFIPSNVPKLLTADTGAIYREGVLIRIPRPERFAIHKLIVSDRRRDGPDSLKSRKDLLQAETLMAILADDRPADLRDAYEDALARGPRWRAHLEASLARSSVSRAFLSQISV